MTQRYEKMFTIPRFFCVATLVLLAACSPEPTDPLAGAWLSQRTDAGPGARPSLVTFKREEQGWSGVEQTLFGDMALNNIKVEGNKVSYEQAFILGKPRPIAGMIDGDEIRTTTSFQGRTIEAVLRRASTEELAEMAANAPKKLPLPALSDVSDNGLARTPPLGWNSWNKFATRIDDRTVREIADALVSTGLRDAGFVYVNIDDGWEGNRDTQGVLHPNQKFPDMKALAEYIHSRGLKFGIYTSPGPRTCGGYEGSHGHEEQDAKMFAAWGVDYLKYDWCSAGSLYKSQEEMQAVYQKMGTALRATGRPIVYALCQYGLFNVGTWGRKVGGNLWRTTFDIRDEWKAMADIGFAQNGKEERTAGPGGWNDPDMLEVGNGGMTLDEYRTHMTLWSILAAPLLLGHDPRQMTSETAALLTNREVIAIDQDALGKQGSRVLQQPETEVWTKPLADGSTAVALFNRGDAAASVEIRWSELGLKPARVRDLWQKTDRDPGPNGYRATLPAHGTVLLRVAAR